MLSFWIFGVCVCVCVWVCVFWEFTPFPSVLFVFHRKNLKNKGTVEINFLISANYSFNVIHIAAVSTYLLVWIYIFIYGCVSLLPPECAVCLCFCICLISNKNTSKKPYYKASVNLTTCCIKHTTRSFWY